MRAASKAILVAALLTAGAVELQAQQHANVERGLLPDKSYQVADVDAVNIFSGVVNVAVPLGGRYSAGGNLSYQLLASYATNGWENGEDIEHEVVDEDGGRTVVLEHRRAWTYPAERMNAGFGWLVTLGDIHKKVSAINWAYRSPDGGEHEFYDTLHAHSSETVWSSDGNALPAAVHYTRDGSYLRLRQFNDRFELDFPDGNIHTFTIDGKLTSMKDRYGHTVTVAYGVRPSGEYAGSTMWTISDSTTREHYVYFRPAAPLDQENTEPDKQQEMVDYVDLGAFDESRAEYRFEYATDNAALPTPSVLMSRRCAHTESSLPETLRTSLLERIRLPVTGMYYEMTYYFGNKVTCSWANSDAPGNIKSLRLPTGATVSYEYGIGEYNTSEWFSTTPLSKRTVSTGGSVVSVTEYEHERYFPGTGERGQRRNVRETDGVKTLKETRHYFSTCAILCSTAREYGLPFSRNLMPAEGPYISSEVITRDGSGNPVVQRATYVTYEADAPLDGVYSSEPNLNRRLRSTRTVFEDGTTTETVYSKFDGLGHHRRAVTTNTNPAGGNSRTSYTNYNPASGEFQITPNSTWRGVTIPLVTAPWILGTYNKQQVTEGTQTSTVASCFDEKGFLTGRRTFASFGSAPSRQTHDLLEIYTPASGAVGMEQYLGGDDPDPGNASDGWVPAPTSTDCPTSSSTDNYRIVHKYDNGYGSRRASYFTDVSGTPLSPFILDQVIDKNTGLPKAARAGGSVGTNGASSPDGLETRFTYDALGRLTSEAPPFSATTNRGASRQTLFTNNSTTVEFQERSANGSTLLRSRKLILDGLGRATKEIRSLPNGTTAWRTWEYDGAGRVTALSAWGNQTPVLTQYQYDHLGRPKKQIAPDLKETSFAYPAPYKTSTTTMVGTSSSNEDPVTVTHEFDGFGRLRYVIDGEGTKTRYTYDARDRMTHVCLGETTTGCLQERTFTYDNRGFLLSETMPELGVSGNGTATYRYDSRGNVVQKKVGPTNGAFDVMMKYDRAGRLTRIHEARTTGTVQRNLKIFEYGTSNSGNDYRSGKLTRAIRNNWLDDISLNVQVVEGYTYEQLDGRVGTRVTHDWECSAGAAGCNVPSTTATPSRKFIQSFTYNALGAVTSLEQPSCLLPQACVDAAIPARTVTNGYQNGWLTSVTWTSAPRAATIDYYDNGMISRVTHANLVKDDIFLDSKRISRPHALQTSNVIEQATCVAPTFTTQPQSQTIASGDLALLTAAAAGETGLTVSYQWYRGAAGNKSTPLGAGTPISGGGSQYTTPALTSTYSYWVEATNTCTGGATASATAVVTVCHSPSITSQPAGGSITRTQSKTLTVVANEHGDASYQWFTVAGTNNTLTAITGATSTTLTVTPELTTKYRVRITNDCGHTSSTIVTVTVAEPPSAPATVTATSNGTANTVTWSASTSTVGIERYEIRRRDGVTFTVTMPAALTYVNASGLTTGTAYLYRVRAVDANGVAGRWSGYDNTVTMQLTDFPLTAGKPIRGIHVGQLRQAIDALRTEVGLTAAWTSYAAATGPMFGSHVTDMRNRLNEARTRLGLAVVTFTRPTLVQYQTSIHALDLQELANGVQ